MKHHLWFGDSKSSLVFVIFFVGSFGPPLRTAELRLSTEQKGDETDER